MSDQQNNPQITAFIRKLERLEPGDHARLKRSAGKYLHESRDIGLFYSTLPAGVPEYQEQKYFLLATLYPLADASEKGNLGMSLRMARDLKKNAKGLDRRVRFLLDADGKPAALSPEADSKFFTFKPGRVYWERLLEDMLGFEGHPEKHVQRRWARSYFGE